MHFKENVLNSVHEFRPWQRNYCTRNFHSCNLMLHFLNFHSSSKYIFNNIIVHIHDLVKPCATASLNNLFFRLLHPFQNLSKKFRPSHAIPSHPMPSHPMPSHPLTSHHIPFHPIPFHPIPSHGVIIVVNHKRSIKIINSCSSNKPLSSGSVLCCCC